MGAPVRALDGRLHTERRGIELHARAHGRADRGASHILAFGHRRFRLDHRRNQARRVFHQLFGRKADLANRGVDDAGLVDAELHFTSLDFMDRLDHVHGYGARLRVRHEASWTEDFTKLTDRAHHVGSGDHGVKIRPAFGLNLVDHVFAAHEIRAGFLRFAQFVAAGDHQHLFRLAEAFRHEDGAADHLVGVLGIDTETHVYFHGLVEFCVLDFLDERNGLFQEVILGFDLLLRGLILFTRLACHVSSLVQAVRSKRAYEPPTERYLKGQHVVYQMWQSRVYLGVDSAAIPQPRGRTGSNAVEAWRWQHCLGKGKFVMSVFDRREARIQEFGDTTAAGLCREADWKLRGRAVGKAVEADHGDRANGMKSW